MFNKIWIVEHRWFIRCYVEGDKIYLSTLSKIVNNVYNIPKIIKSTCPYNNEQEFCKNKFIIADQALFDKLISSHVRLRNITSFIIKLPINNQFWSIPLNLNRLHFVTISSHVDTFQSQLQALFMSSWFIIDFPRWIFTFAKIIIQIHKYISSSPLFKRPFF